jgi:hypothetical protein
MDGFPVTYEQLLTIRIIDYVNVKNTFIIKYLG